MKLEELLAIIADYPKEQDIIIMDYETDEFLAMAECVEKCIIEFKHIEKNGAEEFISKLVKREVCEYEYYRHLNVAYISVF